MNEALEMQVLPSRRSTIANTHAHGLTMQGDAPDALLASAITQAGASFAADELAFLALTSKPEQHFRDRIAFNLYSKLKAESFLVCREWNRIDLAIIATSDQTPILLLELKWMYSINAWADRSDYHAAVLDDEAKALRLATRNTHVYTLLLATHAKEKIPSIYWDVIKYAQQINRCLLLAGTPDLIGKQAESAAASLFAGGRTCVAGEIDGGKAYNVAASVMWWLVRSAGRG